MTPFFALLMPILILFCGLVLDVGSLQLTKLRMQNAADAAAIAAELEYERSANNNSPDWVTHAEEDASINGFTDGQNNTTITVTQDPTTGSYAGRYDAIQVTITRRVKTVFLGTVTGNSSNVSASSVSLVPPCTYALNAKKLATYAVDEAGTGGPSNGYEDCPQYINGSLYSASGNYFRLMQSLLTASSSASVINGRTTTNVLFNSVSISNPLVSDPIFTFATPAYSGHCDHTNYNTTGSSSNYITVALTPGVYCGTTSSGVTTPGITLWWTNTTLSPGLYIITGGANFERTTMNGSGVTLFFTSGGGTGYGQFISSNLSEIDLSAPTTSSNGSIAGIVMFADPNWTNTTAQDFTVNSGGFYGDGIWYLPSTGMQVYNATLWCPNYCPFIVDNMDTYNSTFNPVDNYSYLSGGSPFRPQSVLVQ